MYSLNDIYFSQKAVVRLGLFFCFAVMLLFVPILTTTAKAANIGEASTFLVDPSYDYSERSEIKSILKQISSYGYFYAEDDYYNNLSNDIKLKFDTDLNSLVESFDSDIYPNMKQTFGSEWTPGIDNDSKVIILFTKMADNVGGYFNPNDEYKKSEIINGRSNEGEIIYLNATFLGNERVKSFLAHEFQHMITWYNKTKLQNISEDVWLNEGRSEYASTAIGYDDNYSSSNLAARVKNFVTSPEDSLTEWKNKIQDYSTVNLFSQYLADHFGKKIFYLMVKNSESGIKSINRSLEDLGYSDINLSNIFTNWTVANYLNDETTSGDNKYRYLNPNIFFQNFHLNPSDSYEMGDNTIMENMASIKDWSSKCYEFKAASKSYEENSILEIKFNGDNIGKFAVPYALINQDGTKEVINTALDNNQDSTIIIENFGREISSVLLILNSQKQETGFNNNISNYSFSISAKMAKQKLYSDGSLLKSTESPMVYLIEDGKKRWVTTSAVFVSNGYKWENIILVLPRELIPYPNGENISTSYNLKLNGSVIKGYSPKVYLIENSKKRWITTAEIFISKGYNWNDIISVADEELGLYPDGEDISISYSLKPNGSLIKGSRPEVYLIENNSKRWITNANVFISNGYKWEDIIIVENYELNAYPNGKNIE